MSWKILSTICHYLRKTIDYEGQGVFFFWTVAPYVHYVQKQSGMSTEQSMDAVFEWIQRSSPDYFSEHDHLLQMNHNLAPDQRMPSHLHAHLLARYHLASQNA